MYVSIADRTGKLPAPSNRTHTSEWTYRAVSSPVAWHLHNGSKHQLADTRENEPPRSLENGLGDSASLLKDINCICLIAGIGMWREWVKSFCLKREESLFYRKKNQFHPSSNHNFYVNNEI